MSFDNTEYRNRKDRRKPYYGSKAVDRSCRNHGDCPYCESGRKHPKRIRELDAKEQIKEFYNENTSNASSD